MGYEDVKDLKVLDVLFTAIKNIFNINVKKVSASYDTNLTVICFFNVIKRHLTNRMFAEFIKLDI